MIALIHIKKTAGKSLKHIMRCELGAAHCDVKRWRRDDACLTAAGLRRLKRIHPRLRSIAGHSVRAYSDLRRAEPALAFYTFLREPVARCISQYQYAVAQRRCPPDSFERWIADERVHDLQVKSLAGRACLAEARRLIDEDIGFTGLTERFDESLAIMPRLIDAPAARPRRARVNAAPDQAIRNALRADTQAMAAIRRANALDLELYDYAERVVYPRARRRASRHSVDATAALGKAKPAARFNARFFVNGGYRYLVYKPSVWGYRALAGAADRA